MINPKRVGYLALTKIIPSMGLCNFCRFARWSGSICSGESDLDCRHPLDIVQELACDAWSGSDCWGFRPLYSLAGATDAVGLMLQAKEAAIVAKEDIERAVWSAVDWWNTELVWRKRRNVVQE